jgi:predicted transcriptional regulator
MYKANINCSALAEFLEFLIKQELIEEKAVGYKRNVYKVTQLGVTVLKQFRELKGALPIVEETGNEAINQRPYLF